MKAYTCTAAVAGSQYSTDPPVSSSWNLYSGSIRYCRQHMHGPSKFITRLCGRWSNHQAPDNPKQGSDTNRFFLARWLMLRFLGAVFLIAFISYWLQVDGLVGSRGLLPVDQFLDRAREQLSGHSGYWLLPTLSWLSPTDTMLHWQCALGVVGAILLIANVASKIVLMGLWALYLSLTVAGQMFFHFQWDVLLLETALTLMFITSWNWRPALGRDRMPSALGLLLVRLLLFKLLFLSGITKLLSGDPTWQDLTAMDYHYFTQPIPTWTSWHMQQLPAILQKVSVVVMLAIELIVPFLIFGPRSWRHLAGILVIGLQVMITATGNYGFFNLLTAGLCICLFDDQFWRRLWPGPPYKQSLAHPLPATRLPHWWQHMRTTLATAFILLSILAIPREMVRTYWGRQRLWAEAIFAPLEWITPLRSINGYGLFRVMTTQRPEWIIRGSADQMTWHEYEFRYKPGSLDRSPSFIGPHMPRLDWQMWFAALNPPGHRHLLHSLMMHLFEGHPATLKLLADNPFSRQPPAYLQMVLFKYEFTDRSTRRETGRWWTRQQIGQSDVWVRSLSNSPANRQ